VFNALLSIHPVAWIFGGIGAAMLAAAWIVHGRTSARLARSRNAEGEVVALAESTETDDDGNSSTYYAPVIRFTPPGGAPVTFESSLACAPAEHEVGQRVTVLYMADDPTDAEIKGFFAQWLPVVVIGAIGAGFTFFGVLFASIRLE
jgi:hypothetical protein